MRNPCSGCGLRSCEGECYLADPADYPEPIEEVAEPRIPYVPSPEFLAWCEAADARRFTDCGGDPLKHLEPKSRYRKD
jgi:hypothetical protein